MADDNMKFAAGWYPACTVRRCIRNREIKLSDVTHEYIASGFLPADTFKNFVLEITDIVGAENSKEIINNFIGFLGKLYDRSFNGGLTDSALTAFAHSRRYVDKNGHSKLAVSKLGDYCYMKLESKKVRSISHVPIHRQFIALSYNLLDDMADMVGGTIYGFSTDSVKGTGFNKIDFPKNPTYGGIRVDDSKNIRVMKPRVCEQLLPDYTGVGALITVSLGRVRVPGLS